MEVFIADDVERSAILECLRSHDVYDVSILFGDDLIAFIGSLLICTVHLFSIT
jgi:hypothetical protein